MFKTIHFPSSFTVASDEHLETCVWLLTLLLEETKVVDYKWDSRQQRVVSNGSLQESWQLDVVWTTEISSPLFACIYTMHDNNVSCLQTTHPSHMTQLGSKGLIDPEPLDAPSFHDQFFLCCTCLNYSFLSCFVLSKCGQYLGLYFVN